MIISTIMNIKGLI